MSKSAFLDDLMAMMAFKSKRAERSGSRRTSGPDKGPARSGSTIFWGEKNDYYVVIGLFKIPNFFQKFFFSLFTKFN